MRRAALAGLVLAWLAAPAAGQEPAGAAGLERPAAPAPLVGDSGPERADGAALARALAGTEREPAPPEAFYLSELYRRLSGAIVSRLLRSGIDLPRRLLVAGSSLLVALAVALALWALIPRLLRRRRAARASAVGSVEAVAAAAARNPEWDAAAWRAELERRLAAGSVAEALEAAWWWLARTVAGPRAEPTWTSRDLLRFARRDDLAEPVRRLDAMAFGPARPSADDLRRLVGRLEAALS